jgi:uncharacterized protein
MSSPWPAAAMVDPTIIEATLGPSRWNRIGHDLTSVFTLGKMMALFSMLFGAGVIVYARKFDHEENGRFHTRLSAGAWLWYRRTAWLLAIGFVHAVFLWFGDILFWYAICGLTAVWWLRRIGPRAQIVLGLAAHLFSSLLLLGLTAAGLWALEHGKMPGDTLMGDPAAEFTGYAGSYGATFAPRLAALAGYWFVYGPLMYPGVVGLMVIGMGLTRLGILTGERSTRFYASLALLGLFGGLGLTATLYFWTASRFGEDGGMIWSAFSQFVGIPISLGYMALLIWMVKIDLLRIVTSALANVGRMALSNYLLQTLLCTTFFYGYGGGYFARIDYPGLFAVVATVWTINLVFSALWLRFFRFGPAEWAWRSLTYWKPQPMRR